MKEYFKIEGVSWSPEEFSFLAPEPLRKLGAGYYRTNVFGGFCVDWDYEKYDFYYFNESLVLQAGLWMLLAGWDLIFLDTETTGLDSTKDRIIEIGAIHVRKGEIARRFVSLVDPEIPIPEGATKVNGITNEMVKGQPKVKDVLIEFDKFLNSIKYPVLVGYNTGFDFDFLDVAYKTHLGKRFSYPNICVMRLYTKYYGYRPKLSQLVSRSRNLENKIKGMSLHRAEADAYATFLVLGDYVGDIERLKQWLDNLREEPYQPAP